MTGLPVLDINIFLRHLAQDQSDMALRATSYFEQIERGEFIAETNLPVIFETVFTLERFYKRPKADVRNALLPLLALPGIRLANKRRIRRTLDLYVTYNLSCTDAYQAALVLEGRQTAVVSFDRNYDRIPGAPRVEPPPAPALPGPQQR